MKVTPRILGMNGSAGTSTSSTSGKKRCVCGARGRMNCDGYEVADGGGDDVTLEPHSEDEWSEEDLVFEDEDLPSDLVKEELLLGMNENIAVSRNLVESIIIVQRNHIILSRARLTGL